MTSGGDAPVDVLITGAGPFGLMLANDPVRAERLARRAGTTRLAARRRLAVQHLRLRVDAAAARSGAPDGTGLVDTARRAGDRARGRRRPAARTTSTTADWGHDPRVASRAQS